MVLGVCVFVYTYIRPSLLGWIPSLVYSIIFHDFPLSMHAWCPLDSAVCRVVCEKTPATGFWSVALGRGDPTTCRQDDVTALGNVMFERRGTQKIFTQIRNCKKIEIVRAAIFLLPFVEILLIAAAEHSSLLPLLPPSKACVLMVALSCFRLLFYNAQDSPKEPSSERKPLCIGFCVCYVYPVPAAFFD